MQNLYYSAGNGNDSNDGSTKALAKATLQAVHNLIANPRDEHVTIHCGNSAAETTTAQLTYPGGDTAFSTTRGISYVIWDEDDGGLYKTLNGVSIPMWRIICSGIARPITNGFLYAYVENLWISGATSYGLVAGYSILNNCFVDSSSAATTGLWATDSEVYNTAVVATTTYPLYATHASHLFGCYISGADYSCVEGNITGDPIYDSCFFGNSGHGFSGTIGVCDMSTSYTLKNCILSGLGGPSLYGFRNLYAGGKAYNNIFRDFSATGSYPIYTTQGRAFEIIGPNAFWNCYLDRTTGIVSPGTGLVNENISLIDRTQGDIILSEDPHVDAANGDYNLKPNSPCRGRGLVMPVGFMGTDTEQRPLRCDMGPIQYGIPVMPRAISGKIY